MQLFYFEPSAVPVHKSEESARSGTVVTDVMYSHKDGNIHGQFYFIELSFLVGNP